MKRFGLAAGTMLAGMAAAHAQPVFTRQGGIQAPGSSPAWSIDQSGNGVLATINGMSVATLLSQANSALTTSMRGAKDGVAPLGDDSKVPAANLTFGTTAGTVADGAALATAAGNAASALSTAQGAATSAQSAASSAGTALSTAQSASSTAETAAGNASSALTAASAALPLDGSKAMTGALQVPTITLSNDLDMPADKSVRLADGTTKGSTYLYQDTDGRPVLLSNDSAGATIPSSLKLNGIDYKDSSHGWTANASSSFTDSFLYAQPYLYGTANSADFAHIWASDSVVDPSGEGLAMLQAYDGVAVGAYGNRNANRGRVIISQTPVLIGAAVASNGEIQVNAPLAIGAGFGFPAALDTQQGEFEAGWQLATANYGALNSIGLNYGHEVDVQYDPNQIVGENIGQVIVDQSSGKNNINGNGFPGIRSNIGLSIIGGGFECDVCISKETGDWVGNPGATLFGVKARAYGGADTYGQSVFGIAMGASYGLDLRPVNFLQDSIAVPGHAVAADGTTYSKKLVTGQGIQASTAVLESVTVSEPGRYSSIPAIAVQSPQLGGTAATAAVTAMAANAVLNFGASGSGYVVGDIVTPSGSGLTGVAPTFTVGGVDANGGITSMTLTTQGTLTGVQSTGSPIYAMSGGSGTGAMMLLHFTRDSGNTIFVPDGWRSAATGKGYAAGDTVTVAGDTGTAAAFTVTQVSSTGGIMMDATLNTDTGLKLAAAGSQTAIGGTNGYHSATTSGSGTGASLQVGYGIASVSVTPGSGYMPRPLPILTPDQSNWRNAKLLPVMTATAVDLPLQPDGGRVTSPGMIVSTNGAGGMDSAGDTSIIARASDNGFIYDSVYGDALHWNQTALWSNKLITAFAGVNVQGGLTLSDSGKISLDSSGTMWVQEVSGKVVIGTGSTNLFSIASDGTPTFLKTPVVGTP